MSEKREAENSGKSEVGVSNDNDLFARNKARRVAKRDEEMSLQEYLDLCKKDPMAYASPAERMLAAIGDPEYIDTAKDSRLARIFDGKSLASYQKFEDFYGNEESIEKIISFFEHAKQGLEESKQILYLLGPVGGGKSSLAEKLKEVYENIPFYAIKGSPVFESPLGLFDAKEDGQVLEQEYGINKSRLKDRILSPWAVKRLQEYDDDITQFRVVKVYPSKLMQIGLAKTEPGDENNQDISALVGQTDITKLEEFPQSDPDCYSFSGALCRANQGMMEFVEMFKAPIKVLNPMLTASQEKNYNGTAIGMGPIPFDGILLAHSNESEWQKFKNNKTNEAFIDRTYIVKVPYCTRVDEEVKIYEKLLKNSELADAPCAPGTLKMLAEFAVMTRLVEPENSDLYTKMRIYNGENLKDTVPQAKTLQEYKKAVAGKDEGMSGFSTRAAFKVLSKVFNFRAKQANPEISADPQTLMHVLLKDIKDDDIGQDLKDKRTNLISEYLMPRYIEFLGQEIQSAYMESYDEFGQNVFDDYVTFADMWIQDQEYPDPKTGVMMDRQALNAELEKIEKPAGISNPKDFRHDIVNFVLRSRADNSGQNPDWKSYSKMKTVIERRVFKNMDEILPSLTTAARNADDEKGRNEYQKNMIQRGYTAEQTQRLPHWYQQVRKSR